MVRFAIMTLLFGALAAHAFNPFVRAPLFTLAFLIGLVVVPATLLIKRLIGRYFSLSDSKSELSHRGGVPDCRRVPDVQPGTDLRGVVRTPQIKWVILERLICLVLD
eukprot:251981_1